MASRSGDSRSCHRPRSAGDRVLLTVAWPQRRFVRKVSSKAVPGGETGVAESGSSRSTSGGNCAGELRRRAASNRVCSSAANK